MTNDTEIVFDSPMVRAEFKIDKYWEKNAVVFKNVHVPFHINLGFERKCIENYQIKLKRGNSILAQNCLRTHPKWMGDEHYQDLVNMKVSDLSLPGTHDSGAYETPSYKPTMSSNFFAQEEPILNQLIYGVRFFDFRISCDGQWIKHKFTLNQKIDDIIDNIKHFLKNTRELIILNFQETPDKRNGKKETLWDPCPDDGKDYDTAFVVQLKNQFKSWLVRPDEKLWDVTMAEIWESKNDRAPNQGRIIIHYNSEKSDTNYFFPTPNKLDPSYWSSFSWANKDKTCDLVEFLQAKVSEARQKDGKSPFHPWIVQGQLTPDTGDVVASEIFSFPNLRYLASQSNRLITAYYRNNWSEYKAMYFIADFIKGSNIISEAIKRNLGNGDKTHFIKPRKYHGYRGQWGELKKCPKGSYASSFVLKIQEKQEDGDNTALNDIGMECSDYDTMETTDHIFSGYSGKFGRWPEPINWNLNKRILGFTAVKIRQEKLKTCWFCWSDPDNSAANGLQFAIYETHSNKHSNKMQPGDGYFGEWSDWYDCPKGMLINGFKMRVAQERRNDEQSVTEVEFSCSSF